MCSLIKPKLIFQRHVWVIHDLYVYGIVFYMNSYRSCRSQFYKKNSSNFSKIYWKTLFDEVAGRRILRTPVS